MCGIAGSVNLNGIGPHGTDRIIPALERMKFRGPDGSGIWSDGRCVLGHRRLAVIDLSGNARQPMKRHGYVITFNGEIYNFEALQHELEKLGHAFTSKSDTEILLAGWRQWGQDLLPRLSGMFAFALWDPEAEELVLATDRFGKKPLVYTTHNGQLAFASDLIALRRLSGISDDIDHTALRLFFALRYIPAPWTIYSAARKMPAGSIARFSANGLTVARWDDGPRRNRETFRDRNEAISAIREALDRAVLKRLVSDVPVGTFLSGGIDSAIICASLAAQGRRVKSFTVGFLNAASYYEERPMARSVAAHLGLDHTEIEIGERDAVAAIDDVFVACDEPFADSSALPVYLLSRETRRHVTVALSGDGADEVFAGYRKYQGEVWADTWGRLPTAVRQMLSATLDQLPEGKQHPLTESIRRARRFVSAADAPPVERQGAWSSMLSDAELDALLVSPAEKVPVANIIRAGYDAADDGDSVNRMLFAEQRLGLTGDMLRKVDLMSMANSLEVRCPFLDRDLTDIAAAVPGAWKLERGRGKAILRDAFSDRLPPELFRLPKKGFEMPIAEWLQGSLADRLNAAADPVRLKRAGLIKPGIVEKWMADLKSGRRDTSWQLWAVMALDAWLRHQDS